VTLTTALGYLFAFPLPAMMGIAAKWGAAGLTVSAGIAGWVEMWLLKRSLDVRIGRTGLAADYTARLWASAAAGAAVAWAIKLSMPTLHPVITAVLVLGPYGVAFFTATWLFRLPEASLMWKIGVGMLKTDNAKRKT
jgi:putative peptidoglycan lipid II flippase